MKKDLTELVFILDRSGSMHGLEGDTIGGFNSMLIKQKEMPGNALVTTVLFSDRYELLHDRTAIAGVEPLTGEAYVVGGSTALLDALGRTIDKIIAAHKHTAEPERPGKTVFVITTDGLENASSEYSRATVKAMVSAQQKNADWEFLFLGANIDAIAVANDIGIQPSRAAQFISDAAGTQLNYAAIDTALVNLRSHKPLSSAWKAAIEKDVSRRS